MLNSLPNETANFRKRNNQDKTQTLSNFFYLLQEKKFQVKCSSSATDCKYMHSRSQAKQFICFFNLK